MIVKPFRPVNQRYGAPMGRRNGSTPLTTKTRLCARQSGHGPYDTGGAYWGDAHMVYAVWNKGDETSIKYVRADSRPHAITVAIRQYWREGATPAP